MGGSNRKGGKSVRLLFLARRGGVSRYTTARGMVRWGLWKRTPQRPGSGGCNSSVNYHPTPQPLFKACVARGEVRRTVSDKVTLQLGTRGPRSRDQAKSTAKTAPTTPTAPEAVNWSAPEAALVLGLHRVSLKKKEKGGRGKGGGDARSRRAGARSDGRRQRRRPARDGRQSSRGRGGVGRGDRVGRRSEDRGPAGPVPLPHVSSAAAVVGLVRGKGGQTYTDAPAAEVSAPPAADEAPAPAGAEAPVPAPAEEAPAPPPPDPPPLPTQEVELPGCAGDRPQGWWNED